MKEFFFQRICDRFKFNAFFLGKSKSVFSGIDKIAFLAHFFQEIVFCAAVLDVLKGWKSRKMMESRKKDLKFALFLKSELFFEQILVDVSSFLGLKMGLPN